MATARRVSYTRTSAYSIQYHIVFCTKYRKPVLVGEIKEDLLDILHNIADKTTWSIEEVNTDKDHIHLLINATPQDIIPNIIKTLKGPASRELYKKHPELKDQLWGGHLWSPSYFIATTNDNTAEQIRAYIQRQGDKQ